MNRGRTGGNKVMSPQWTGSSGKRFSLSPRRCYRRPVSRRYTPETKWSTPVTTLVTEPVKTHRPGSGPTFSRVVHPSPSSRGNTWKGQKSSLGTRTVGTKRLRGFTTTRKEYSWSPLLGQGSVVKGKGDVCLTFLGNDR